MKPTFIQIRMAAAGALAAVMLAACGGGGSSTPPEPPPPAPVTKGTVSIAITNRHACDLEAVNITISKFRVNTAPLANDAPASGWVDVPVSPGHKVNLLKLTNGALEALGETTLEAGHYNWLRVVLDTGAMANTVVPRAGDAEQALELPGWAQSGGDLRDGFDVVAGQKTEVVIDGNPCPMVAPSAQGQRTFPGLRMVPSAPNGIRGFVSPAALANHVLVTAEQQIGLGLIAASAKPDPVTGEFWLSHLEAAKYNVIVTADNSAVSVIGDVPVTLAATTALSTREAPIPPAPPSKTGSISGTFTFPYYRSNSVTMWVKQRFVPGLWGPTIQNKVVDATNDTFTLSGIPLAAPQYAAYSGTLPLAFGTSTAAAGKYILVPLGSALTGNGVDVDISAGSATGVNLVLIPTGP